MKKSRYRLKNFLCARIAIGVVAVSVMGMMFLGAGAARGENWPEFLGPGGNGIAPDDEQVAPLTWSEDENIVWRVPVLGKGWSSPVIWEDQIWLTTASEDALKRYALCFDKNSGELLREILLFEVAEVEPSNSINSFASSTPVIEAGRVYIHFGPLGTVAIDTLTFEIVWQRTDIEWFSIQGHGASPILWNSLLILTCDGADVQYLIALDKTTGKTVWKTPRSFNFDEFDIVPNFRKGYCTPVVVTYNDREYLLSCGSAAGYAYDPATGAELWRFDFPRISETSTMRPRLWNDRAILNSGFSKAILFAVKIDGSGRLGDDDVFWSNDRNIIQCPSPVLVGDVLYYYDGRGILQAISADDGTTLWQKRVGGNFWASPIYHAGRIYYFDDAGKTTVITADPQSCEILATNELGDGCMGTPAFADGAIYMRTKSELIRIQELR